MKKFIALIIAIALCLVPASATSIGTDGGTGETAVQLTAEPATFSVTVPTNISFKVMADGTVTCPTDVKILNESTAAVKVTSVHMNNGTWTLVPFTTNMAVELVDTHKIGFQIKAGTDTTATTTTGSQDLTINSAQWIMPEKDSELALTFSAVASAVSRAQTEATKAASIIFTIAWAT